MVAPIERCVFGSTFASRDQTPRPHVLVSYLSYSCQTSFVDGRGRLLGPLQLLLPHDGDTSREKLVPGPFLGSPRLSIVTVNCWYQAREARTLSAICPSVLAVLIVRHRSRYGSTVLGTDHRLATAAFSILDIPQRLSPTRRLVQVPLKVFKRSKCRALLFSGGSRGSRQGNSSH